MRAFLILWALTLAACVPSSAERPTDGPAPTHHCTPTPSGLAECHLIEEAA